MLSNLMLTASRVRNMRMSRNRVVVTDCVISSFYNAGSKKVSGGADIRAKGTYAESVRRLTTSTVRLSVLWWL